ncbi:MAG: 16S rRNA (uracil(1498)-N(3))-methyltransferase [Armatimonadota bacterium]|nr:16S rRNA (uracil(1498)-N(3))-methyltransferase [Armatimonadota bacterium]
MPRVFLSPSVLEAGLNGEEFELDYETAKKLTRVLRLTPGETFIAFDGLGGEWECALTATEGEGSKKNVSARAVILAEREPLPRGRLHLSVAQAIPKGDKMELVLQKGTELGVAEFWPIDAERSVSKLHLEDDPERAATRTERWRKIVAQAAAQCGRADVPIVHAICDFVTAVASGTNGSRCFMLDEQPEAEPLRVALQREPLALESPQDEARIMLLIGPEGGWTPREREWAERYGVEAVGLGRLILRTETAALVAAAILQWQAGELG